MNEEERELMEFEYPEDKKFFASMFCDGDLKKFNEQFMPQFDFRDAVAKRNVFNRQKKEIMMEILKSKQKQCELRLVSECSNEKIVLDHIIPLSSNELNKHLRHMTVADGKKVPSQSFGSNHLSNFLLACEACNNHKKHRFVRKIGDKYEIVNFFI